MGVGRVGLDGIALLLGQTCAREYLDEVAAQRVHGGDLDPGGRQVCDGRRGDVVGGDGGGEMRSVALEELRSLTRLALGVRRPKEPSLERDPRPGEGPQQPGQPEAAEEDGRRRGVRRIVPLCSHDPPATAEVERVGLAGGRRIRGLEHARAVDLDPHAEVRGQLSEHVPDHARRERGADVGHRGRAAPSGRIEGLEGEQPPPARSERDQLREGRLPGRASERQRPPPRRLAQQVEPEQAPVPGGLRPDGDDRQVHRAVAGRSEDAGSDELDDG
jgi:hypothetical protein